MRMQGIRKGAADREKVGGDRDRPGSTSKAPQLAFSRSQCGTGRLPEVEGTTWMIVDGGLPASRTERI